MNTYLDEMKKRFADAFNEVIRMLTTMPINTAREVIPEELNKLRMAFKDVCSDNEQLTRDVRFYEGQMDILNGTVEEWRERCYDAERSVSEMKKHCEIQEKKYENQIFDLKASIINELDDIPAEEVKAAVLNLVNLAVYGENGTYVKCKKRRRPVQGTKVVKMTDGSMRDYIGCFGYLNKEAKNGSGCDSKCE